MGPRRFLSSPPIARIGRLAAVGVMLLSTLACDGASPTSPTTPGPEPGAASASSIAGVVTDATGEALSGADVAIVEGRAAGRHATTGDDGRYRMDGLAAGTVGLDVSASGYVSQRIDVDVSGPTRVDVRLPSAGDEGPVSPEDPSGPGAPEARFAISGRIEGASVGALGGAHVTVTSGPNAGRNARATPEGAYALDDLLPGRTTLEAKAPGFAAGTRTVELEDDEVLDFTLTPAAFAIRGRVIDALAGTGVGAVEIAADGVGSSTSDASGDFGLGAAPVHPTTAWLTLTGTSIVERRTRAQMPGADVEISVIPAAFDLHAFDEMFRSPRLRRWRQAPRLLVEQGVVEFTSEDMTAGTSTDVRMTASEVGSLVTDLAWALPQLSGGRFTQFAAVDLRTTESGAPAQLLNDDVITVVRAAGLTAATGYWGFSRWRYEPDGTVTAGLILLDADFDAGTSPYRRSLRAHELGHALGYQHVTSRPSVMNAAARLEPTAFDLEACRIAFEREPGNRAPDIDPDAASVNRAGGARWSRPVR